MEDEEIPDEGYYSEDDGFMERQGGPRLLLTKEDKRRIPSPWKYALIVKLLDRNLSYTYLCNRLKYGLLKGLWSKFQNIKMKKKEAKALKV